MKSDRSVYQALTMIGQFGINMLVPVGMCSFVGMILDRKLGTNFIIIILFFFGAVCGGVNVYRFCKQIFDRAPSENAYSHGGSARYRKEPEKKGGSGHEIDASESKQNTL